MSDDDFGFGDDDDMMMDDDMDDFGSDPDNEDPGVQIENFYYEAKELSRDDLNGAIEGFENVLAIEEEKGKWGFKALKHMVMIYHQLGKHDQVVNRFTQMMSYTKKAISSNDSEKPITSLLEYCGNSPKIGEIYEATLAGFKEAKNEKAILRLQLRMAKVLLEKKDYARLERSLRDLHASCRNDPSKSSQYMEVLALEIVMHSERGNTRKLKELYDRANSIKSAINVPSITAIINECGGKMYMREKKWQNAYRDLFQAFKDYDEIGNKKALQCLKYLVLASMLSSSDIDPFNDPRAKAFKNKEEIQGFMDLVSAYQNHDIRLFESILKKNEKSIMEDEFIRNYIQDLLTNIRTHYLMKLIKPYTCITLDYIAKEMNITTEEVEELLVALILDKEIAGSIDQVNRMLTLASAETSSDKKYLALEKWSKELESVNNSIVARVN